MVCLLTQTFFIIEHGRQPKYDLKSPVILLRDEAKTHSLAEGEVPPTVLSTKPRPAVRRSSTYSDKPIESSQEEFMAFVDDLLGSLGNVPLSATEPSSSNLTVPPNPSPTPTREQPFKPLTCREAVVSIVRKGARALSNGKAKIGVFEIGKNGIPVAKLTLPRTIFKLGDTIEGIIDLVAGGNLQCYQVRFPSYCLSPRRYDRLWSRQKMLILLSASDLKVPSIEPQNGSMRPRSNSRHSPVASILHLRYPPV